MQQEPIAKEPQGQPQPPDNRTQLGVGMMPGEELRILTSDGVISVFFQRHVPASRKIQMAFRADPKIKFVRQVHFQKQSA